MSDIGEEVEVINTLFKPLLSCGGTLISTDLALSMAWDHVVKPEDAAEITVRVAQHWNFFRPGVFEKLRFFCCP